MISAERSEVQFGRTRILYAIRRSSRRETVAITIDPRQGVLLTAPRGVAVERLDRVVYAKARWIVERLRRKRDLALPVPAREFVSGETFLYLGRQYRLRVEGRTDGAMDAGLRRGWFVVAVPNGLDDSGRAERVRAGLVAWYESHAAERLAESAEKWAKRLGLPEPRILVREPRKRWGSCNAEGTVRFNWRIVQAPISLLDYVVAHELVHLRHRDHTRAFWATLGRVMPDYETRKQALRALGPRLSW